MALVHAPGTGISIAQGQVPQKNTLRDNGIYAKKGFKRPRLGKGRRRGLLGGNYTEPTSHIREKMETILHTWGGETT